MSETALLAEFRYTVQKLEEEAAINVPHGREIMDLARAMCVGDGYDPDMVVMGFGPPHTLRVEGPKNQAVLQAPIRVLWSQYWAAAITARIVL